MYPHYAWIIYGWYEERWWTEEIAQEHIDCTDEDIRSFLVRARPLLIQIAPEPDDFDLPADPGMVSITDCRGSVKWFFHALCMSREVYYNKASYRVKAVVSAGRNFN